MELVSQLWQWPLDEIFGGDVIFMRRGVRSAHGKDMRHKLWMPMHRQWSTHLHGTLSRTRPTIELPATPQSLPWVDC